MQSSESLYQLIDLSLQLGNRIDVQWGFFITVHMALFGGIIYVDRPLGKTEKAVAIGLYIGFATVNYLMMASQLDLQNSLYREIAVLHQEGSNLSQYFVERNERGWFETAYRYSLYVHVLMLLVVMLTIFYDRKRNETD